jgi:uncharacterized membrane protein
MNDRSRLIRDIGINAGLPYVTYLLLSHEGVPTVKALAAGAVFPVSAIIIGFIRERRVQTIGMIVLAATLASILAALYFTSPFLALAKGSVFSTVFALLLFGSLFARRPLVFHLAALSQDPEDKQQAETLWQTEPRYRRLMRHITAVWAGAFIVEGCLRLTLIPLLPIAVFLPISEAMSLACIGLMIAWTWRYAGRQMEQIEAPESATATPD